MYTAPFKYHTPGSVDEAIALLTRHGDEAKLLAGGHSLIPVMKLRLAQPAHLIDLRKVTTLVGVREERNAIVVGAMTTYAAVEASDVVRGKLPMLAEAIRLIGDPQVRNRGTVGGSLAHADPGADLPAAAEVAERIRAAVGGAAIEVGGVALPVTVSLGCAVREAGEAGPALLARADARLYAAKAGGRNRVQI
jgi:xanthine dehydrogenase iron-sulfur cluster and FAD-binding subunit A